MRVVLASSSPRRKDLLALLQIPFEVAKPAFVEQPRSDLLPEAQARLFAEEKVRSCEARYSESVLIGSDTLIAIGSEVLGKPATPSNAVQMLRRLRDRAHLIHTAVALARTTDGRRESAVETVRVVMKPLTDQDIERYVATGEGMGKAGAYAIQGRGAELIASIQGDYTAAVGLPLRLVASMLSRMGVPVPVDLDRLYQSKPFPNWDRFSAE